jgi:NAD(P)-dependent dehydrogenase (short-subunit alcohol dehydrogenase family)
MTAARLDQAQFLAGKVAVVTGAGRGIGRAIARRLAASGAGVVLAARGVPQLEETLRLIESAGGRATAVSADVSMERDVERLASESREAFGGVDVLVNNAGVAPSAGIEEMEPAVFDRIVATNIRAVYLCTRAFWGDLAARRGAIVNISSVAALDPFPGLGAYGASKAFVNLYTKALAQEGKPLGIRVFGVAPGAVETPMMRALLPDFPAGEALSPGEVAEFVERLIDPACGYATGETIAFKR